MYSIEELSRRKVSLLNQFVKGYLTDEKLERNLDEIDKKIKQIQKSQDMCE